MEYITLKKFAALSCIKQHTTFTNNEYIYGHLKFNINSVHYIRI